MVLCGSDSSWDSVTSKSSGAAEPWRRSGHSRESGPGLGGAGRERLPSPVGLADPW